MSHKFQCGVGMQGGVDVGDAIPNRALDALVKADMPFAMLHMGAANACDSIKPAAIIEEVVKSRPELVGFGLLVMVALRHPG